MQALQMEEVTYAPRPPAVPRRVRFGRSKELARTTGPAQVRPGWQIEAIEEYEESLGPLDARMRHDLASRILALTGHRVAADEVYADARSQVAVTTVDGIVFKLLKENLVILRACVQCNCCQFASMPITNRAELGYMLTEWEPRCPDCAAEDSNYWIYTD
ncbi:MAG: hypothetical protein M3328_02855 [Chloroflexota bacterium]|nr:hypothetical protein [Chloroflexota bacterium]